MSTNKKLLPSNNEAAYPTLLASGHARKFLLAGVGAAALVGLNSCLGGDPPSYEQPPDAGTDHRRRNPCR
ncbi:MAG: hypothetical protein QM765_39550 [Myxococcales bacterium]